MTSCAALTNPSITDIFICAFNMATGNFVLSLVLIFILLVYGLYFFKVPMLASSAIIILALFVFAGAGIAESGMPEIFKTLLWVVLMFFGVIVVLAFWRMRQ